MLYVPFRGGDLSGLTSTAYRNLGAQRAGMVTVYVVSLDHAIECLAIDREHTRRSLFVATCVDQHAGDITSFDF